MDNGIETNLCTICMDELIEPKSLLCDHTFCKECVDSLLKFRYNGSASIICPMKCEEETLLSCDDTTNCLETNFESFIHLDGSTTSDDKKARCEWKTCESKICTFCCACNLNFCEKCWGEHLHYCSNCVAYTPVKYNCKTKDISVVCPHHQTKADYICLNCHYEFVCVYCKHRNHKGHFIENIHKSSMRIKSTIDFQRLYFENERKYMQTTKLAVNELDHCEEKLTAELKKRKLKCLLEYLSLLNEEEAKILLEFREKSSIFNEMINREHCSASEDDFDSITKCFDKVGNMNDLHMLIARKQMENDFSKLFSIGRAHSVPSMEVSLSSSINSPSEQLGNFCVEINEMLSCDQHGEASSICFDFQQTEINLEDSDFVRDFEDCLSLGKDLTTKEIDSKLNPDAIPVFFPSKETNLNVKPTKDIYSNLNPEAIPVFYPNNDSSSLQENIDKDSPLLNPSAKDFSIVSDN